jgi:hypothetical protein
MCSRFPPAVGGLGSGSGKLHGAAAILVGFGVSGIAEVACKGSRGERRSVAGEAVTASGFDDEAGGGHGREAFVESGGADAAGCPRFEERTGLLALVEGCGDALIDGSWSTRCSGSRSVWTGSRARALGRWISSSITPGMAAAARCSTVRTIRSLLSRRRWGLESPQAWDSDGLWCKSTASLYSSALTDTKLRSSKYLTDNFDKPFFGNSYFRAGGPLQANRC